ncbi:MAG: DNA-directed RNA polymerase subunit L [Candidatus Thorarchaeota archaeon]
MKINLIESSDYDLKIEIVGEGHSFCNLLRRTLLEEPSVEFAGYALKHPLLSNPVFTLRTRDHQAKTVLREALEKMLARVEEFRKEFVNSWKE